MKKKILRPKYRVQKITGVDPKGVYGTVGLPMLATDPNDVDSPFVLMPRKDPAAFYAILAYAQMCEDDLAGELRQWLEKIVLAPPVFGTQGLRNRVVIKLEQIKVVS